MPLVKDPLKMLRRLLLTERLRRELRRRKLLLTQPDDLPRPVLDSSSQAGVSNSQAKPRGRHDINARGYPKNAKACSHGAVRRPQPSHVSLRYNAPSVPGLLETIIGAVRAVLARNSWLRKKLPAPYRDFSHQTNKVDKHQAQLTDIRNTVRELRRRAATHPQNQREHASVMQPAGNASRPIVVAVDLLPLLRGGENGGIKPAIFSLLGELARQIGGYLSFVFLTNSASHGEVRQLARPNEILICVLENPRHPADAIENGGRTEFKLIPPPPELLRMIDVDLLYCPFGMTPFHVPGIPTIALIADVLHRDYPFTLTQPQIAEREAYIAEAIRVATKIQCISRSGIERMVANYTNIDATKFFYTYLPIHLRLGGSSNSAEERTEERLPRPFFFYPANLWVHKNHEILLLAYARYREQAGNAAWDLLLTFEEDVRAADLKSLAGTLGISEYVRFAGFVPEHELRDIWQRAGALVFPSLHEGFGIPLVEAMHYGVPIITSTEFSLNEIAGDACYLIDPRKPSSLANALWEVSTNPGLRAELVRRARERLTLFDLKIAGRILLDQFYSAIRTEADFPRRPDRPGQTVILSLPTPASGERWKIEIACCHSDPHQKLSVYLDDFPYGTFHQANGKNAFSFVCRPQGRILSVRRDRSTDSYSAPQSDSPDDHPVTRIVAQDFGRRRIILYEKPAIFLNG